jgi:hypothetical protein
MKKHSKMRSYKKNMKNMKNMKNRTKRHSIKRRQIRGRGSRGNSKGRVGGGWFDTYFGRTTESTGYGNVSQDESDPREVFLTKQIFSDEDSRGKYTGKALLFNGVYFRKDSNGLMEYDNGNKYIGGFDRNMINGNGSYYNKREKVDLSGMWYNNIPDGLMEETKYDDKNEVISTKKIHYKDVSLLQKADSATGFKKGSFDPKTISSMPKIPEWKSKTIKP